LIIIISRYKIGARLVQAKQGNARLDRGILTERKDQYG
jgi:hypothetical protein